LRGWQVAFLAVGLPGLVLALWTRTLREPARGQSDGILTPAEPHPLREFLRELRAVMPPLTLLHLRVERAGARAVLANLFSIAILTAGAYLATAVLGNPIQWICLALGIYAGVSWVQALRLRDRVAAEIILATPALRWAALAFSGLAAAQYGLGFWTAPFFIRIHHVDEARAGLVLGATHAVAGLIGVTLGGLLADFWRRRTPAGRLYVTLLSATLPVPIVASVLTVQITSLAFALYFPQSILTTLWAGPAVSTIQDLVLPRMRGTASAAYLLLVTIVGLAIGPYAIGRLSVALGDLRAAMLVGLSANLFALACGLLAARTFARDEASKVERARRAGEVFLT